MIAIRIAAATAAASTAAAGRPRSRPEDFVLDDVDDFVRNSDILDVVPTDENLRDAFKSLAVLCGQHGVRQLHVHPVVGIHQHA